MTPRCSLLRHLPGVWMELPLLASPCRLLPRPLEEAVSGFLPERAEWLLGRAAPRDPCVFRPPCSRSPVSAPVPPAALVSQRDRPYRCTAASTSPGQFWADICMMRSSGESRQEEEGQPGPLSSEGQLSRACPAWKLPMVPTPLLDMKLGHGAPSPGVSTP